MLPSLSEVSEKQNLLFDPKTFSGARLSFNSKLSETSYLLSSFEFHQVYVDVQPSMGVYIQKRENPRSIQFVYGKNFKNLSKLLVSIGNKNLIQYDCFPYLNPGLLNSSLRLRCDFSQNDLLPSVLANIQTKFANFSFRLEKNLMHNLSVIDFKGSIGSPFLALSLQYSRNIFDRSKYFYSFVISQHTSKQQFQIIYKKQQRKSISVRYQTDVFPSVRAGLLFSVDSDINSYFQVAWIANLYNSIVHSSVNTNGVVSSVYKRKLHDGCDLVLSGKLDHKEQNYKFGLGLHWDF